MNKKILTFVFSLTIIVLIFIIFVARSMLNPITTTNKAVPIRKTDLSKQPAKVDKDSKSIKQFDVFKPEEIKKQETQEKPELDDQKFKRQEALAM